MHRTIGDGYIVESGKNIYADEDPPTRDATQVRHQEMNSLQEEICNVITTEGYSLNAPTEAIGQMVQLNTAINKKVADAVASEALTRSTADAAEAMNRGAGDAVLNAKIDALTANNITNDSSVAGAKVKDALNQLNSDISGIGALVDPVYYISGYSYVRRTSPEDTIEFGLGSALDSTGTVLLPSPDWTPNPWWKKLLKGTPYAKGYGGNMLPASLHAGSAIGTRYYLFVCKLGDTTIDFGADTDPDATNLQADPVAGVTHWRRIGFCQVKSFDVNSIVVYQMFQETSYHRLFDWIYYTVPVASWGAVLSGDNIYLPGDYPVVVEYAVFPPDGGAARSVVAPRSTPVALWTSAGMYHSSSDSVYGLYGSAFISAHHTTSNHGFSIQCDPYSGRSGKFAIMGFWDWRGQAGHK